MEKFLENPVLRETFVELHFLSEALVDLQIFQEVPTELHFLTEIRRGLAHWLLIRKSPHKAHSSLPFYKSSELLL